MKHRFYSAWECDSDQDYYAQFEPRPGRDEPDDWEDDQYDDRDCDYWESNCYGR